MVRIMKEKNQETGKRKRGKTPGGELGIHLLAIQPSSKSTVELQAG